MNLLESLSQKFSPITIYALVGPSGTGKSFRSKLLAEEYGINTLIDDGLLIQDDKIIAGHSAKREKTYMGAVRVALFDDKDHRDDVARVLKKTKIKKLLILGTSEKMVSKICTRLQLPQPFKFINITDIASEEEINKAQKSRLVEGKHVIPVPSIEIQKSYPQIFSNAIHEFFSTKTFFKKKSKGSERMIEKSVVQPEFSKKGRVEISEAAMIQMVMHCIVEIAPDVTTKKITIKTNSRGYKFIVLIDVPFGTQLTGKIHKIQQYIIDQIESFAGILIEEVSIVIDKITKDTVQTPIHMPETTSTQKTKKLLGFIPVKTKKSDASTSSKREAVHHSLARTHNSSSKK